MEALPRIHQHKPEEDSLAGRLRKQAIQQVLVVASLEDQHLVHTSAEPLLTPDECDAIIAESEEWATRAGG